jgi:hypothetical protein
LLLHKSKTIEEAPGFMRNKPCPLLLFEAS